MAPRKGAEDSEEEREPRERGEELQAVLQAVTECERARTRRLQEEAQTAERRLQEEAQAADQTERLLRLTLGEGARPRHTTLDEYGSEGDEKGPRTLDGGSPGGKGHRTFGRRGLENAREQKRKQQNDDYKKMRKQQT